MRPIEILKKAEGLKFTSEDGDTVELELLAPLTPNEMTNCRQNCHAEYPKKYESFYPTAVGLTVF
jgi:hypothetical protein